MELTETITIAVAATALIPVVIGAANDAARLISQADLTVLKGPVASAMLCTSLLRSAPTVAVTPPPIERLQSPERLQNEEAAPPAATDDVAAAAGEYQDHIVEVGDSLWAIACRTLRQRNGTEPSNLAIDTYWRTIYRANREVVGADPNLIYPGQRLVLP